MREGCRLGKWRRIPLLQGVSRLSVNGKITMDLSILSVGSFPRKYISTDRTKLFEEGRRNWDSLVFRDATNDW